METIIGSSALKEYFPEFRNPKDLDILRSNTNFSTSKSDNIILEIIPAPSWWIHSKYASPQEILTLKASHIFWTPMSRKKHIGDIEFLLRKGYEIDDSMFFQLYDHWKDIYGERSQSNQDLSQEEFFNDYLSREIHHDQVHLWINQNPVYKKILLGDGSVNICEDKFLTLSSEEKLNVIREEVYVLSFERWRSEYTTSPGLTYRNNLIYFIGHLAPTWLSLFAMKNLLKLNKPEIEYKTIIDKQLEIWKQKKLY
jgi:hypothetical protein